MKFDEILITVGEFGRYQKLIYIVFVLVSIPSAFHAISIVFLAGSSDHWCAVPQWKNENCSEWNVGIDECDELKRYASIPQTNASEVNQCSMYNVSTLPFVPLPDGNSTTASPLIDYHSLDVVPCPAGWEHDTSQYTSTINMDFGLVCDNKDLADISSSLWFVGVLTGSLVFGYIADRIGRLATMWVCITGQLVFGVAVAFAPSFWWFAFLRTLLAMNNMGVFLVAFVLGTEFVGPSKRVVAGTGIMIGFSIGYMGLSVIAYLIRDWRHLQLALSVPVVLFYVFIPFVPESARWLLSVGKVEKANVVIDKISKTNNVPLPQPVFTQRDKLQMQKERGENRATLFDLFRNRNLRMESFNLLFNWFVESLVYYGLALSSSDFGVNVYIAAFVSGAIEVPAYVSSMFALEHFGRRPSTCFYLLLAGVACILTIVIPAGIGRVVMATIGKFGVTASFSIIYIYTAELYPTPLRSVGIGMCSMSSRIGGIIAPLIRISGRSWRPLPFIIYGAASIAAGLLALLLPETKGRKLPETVEEGENFRNATSDKKYIPVDEDDKDAVPMTTVNNAPDHLVV
ncbi:organic cation transporter protein isoform X1 [Strongylocentrotus purpuratus]|uniref:Major facilitator superfamily (MFS) profile domain-containing protein n=1 Tax=Strongylocentrotus purpuratus TaxID=7668 RepID=A0A7M7PK68_STRPU|nr:organic cation transporter protein isoform X1 [Strongylocentrotus purpuratus]